MPGQIVVNEFKIKVAGSLLPDEVGDSLQECIVDQSLNMPDMCVVKIWDHDLKIMDGTLFDLGKPLEVIFSTEGGLGSTPVTLFKGEITAIEPEFGEGHESMMVIRGYDKSWRGYRKTTSRAMKEIKDSDVARKIAGNIGLSPEIDSTTEVFKQLFQDNQSDLEYLQERAKRIGHKVMAKDGKLYFKKAETNISEGPTLKWGENLVAFHPRLTAAEQVSSVKVQGWDPMKKQTIQGEATSPQGTHPSIGYGKNGSQAAKIFSAAELLVTDIPVQSPADATAVAKGHLNRINGTLVQAEGEAHIAPEIAAGSSVTIENVGTKFGGKYHVTSVRHVYNPEGLRSYFSVQGNSTGTFTELLGRQEPIRRWHGLYPAIVTNNKTNEGDWGMVKVAFPWLGDMESYWARLISPGAGKERGFYLLPEVDDEVMVAFEQGDFNRPYVLGGLWNGKDKPPEKVADVVGGDGKVNHRIWKSRYGNYILFDDTKNQEKLEIVTVNGHHVTFNDKEKEITIVSGSGVEIKIDKSKNVTLKNAQNLTVSANGNMSFDAKGNIDIKATGNLTAQATGNANFKGAQATFEGVAKAELKAPTVSVSGSALTEVKGALVKIN